MKTITLFICYIFTVNCYIINIPDVSYDATAPTGRVRIQKLLLPLFENVCERSTDPLISRLSDEFLANPAMGDYLKTDVINNLLSFNTSKGLLQQGEIFTEYNNGHMNELRIIYEVLRYAGSFDTFYKAACWARQNVNCGIFIDAIYLSIINRKDTESFLLPPLYEVLPNYFIRKEYITKASSLLRGEDTSPADFVRDEGNSYIFDVNYTTNYFDEITDMAYLNEDIDLNSYYFINRLKMLQWSMNEDQNNNRGYFIYQIMKQLMTRYNLERFSHGLQEVEAINWNSVDTDDTYDPMLVYSNGNSFTLRPFLNLGMNSGLEVIKNIENNITTVAIHLRDAGYNKMEILNYLMDILVIGDKSYEYLVMKMFNNVDSTTSTISALGHYMTTLRDPLFWKINKKVIDLIDGALQVLPAYTKNQLYFPGVQVTNIDVKKIMTSCDNYEFDVTDALKTTKIDSRFQIKFNQYRLSHKSFSIRVSIASLVLEKALVKLFIGPKTLPGQFYDKRNLFMLLDSFEANLKIGSNLITRTSDQMSTLSDEFISLRTLQKYIQDSEFGLDVLPLRSIGSQTGFPSRLILPKGTSEGLPLQIFVYVAPISKVAFEVIPSNMESNYNDIWAPGYPLDQDIDFANIFDLPNTYIKDVIITHKSLITSQSIGNDSNTYPGSGPGYYNFPRNYPTLSISAKPKFDYESKKNKYGKLVKKENITENIDTGSEITEKVDVIDVTSDTSITDTKIEENDIIESNVITSDDMLPSNIITPDFKINSNDILQNKDLYIIDNTAKMEDDVLNNLNKPLALTMPKKKSFSLFKIIFRPVKIEDSSEVFY